MKKVVISEPVRKPKDTFTCSNGKIVKIKSVSRWLIDSRMSSRPKVPVPLYEVETAGGGKEMHEHDATTLQTDEDKVAWENYLDLKRTEERKFSEDMFKLLMMYGTEIEYPEDDLWKAKQEFVGILVPSDPVELYLHYLRSEVFGIEEDATDLITEVMRVSGADEEAINSIKDSFRTAIQEQRSRKSAKREGKLEGKPKVRRTRGSKSVGDTSKPSGAVPTTG